MLKKTPASGKFATLELPRGATFLPSAASLSPLTLVAWERNSDSTQHQGGDGRRRA